VSLKSELSWQVTQLKACRLLMLALQIALASHDDAFTAVLTVRMYNTLAPLLQLRPHSIFVLQALVISIHM